MGAQRPGRRLQASRREMAVPKPGWGPMAGFGVSSGSRPNHTLLGTGHETQDCSDESETTPRLETHTLRTHFLPSAS